MLVIAAAKSRKTLLARAKSVGPQARTRTMRAAQTLAGRWRFNKAPIRFDLVVLGAGLLPRHERGGLWREHANI